MGSYHLLPCAYCIVVAFQICKRDDLLFIHGGKVPADNAADGGGQRHAAYIAGVVNYGTDFCIIRAGVNDNPYQPAPCNNVHVFFNPVVFAFVNQENAEPVPAVVPNDMGGYFFIAGVFLVQLHQLPEVVQFILLQLDGA